MIFQNPWGLLALLALPAILALHFFRSRRETRVIGGLHFWQDAAARLPMGRNWDRLLKSASLALQLLAALLLALLLAGLDAPGARSLRRYTVILDDSASMTAEIARGDTPAERGRKLLSGWAPENARFTVVAAGAAPRILAGPFAPRDEMLRALAEWRPEAPACDLAAALALAAKFAGGAAEPPAPGGGTEEKKSGAPTGAAGAEKGGTAGKRAEAGGQKILFVTDSASSMTAKAGLLETAALGRPLANAGLTFADRARVSAGRDRVMVTARNYSGAPATVKLTASAEGAAIFTAGLKLAANGAAQQAFETGETAADIRVELAADALAADNAVTLAPVAIKFVSVGRQGLDFAARAVTAAVKAVPYATEARPEKANLLLSGSMPDERAAPLVACVFDDRPGTAPARVAAGSELRAEAGAPLFDGVGFEGTLWPYYPGKLKRDGAAELWARGTGAAEPLAAHYEMPGREVFLFNARLESSNLFKQPAWPLMMRNMIERTRDALPGLSRANYNAGETVAPNLATSGSCELLRNGRRAALFAQPPALLAGLAPGVYELRREGRVLEHFAVNLIAPAESDLQAAAPRKADLGALGGENLSAVTINPAVYYALLLGALAALAGAWICQDRSR